MAMTESRRATIQLVGGDCAENAELRRHLAGEGFLVVESGDCAEALDAFRAHLCELVIADLRSPQAAGLDLVREFKTIAPRTMIVVVADAGAAPAAVQAMQNGAFDYLTHPFRVEELLIVLHRALRYQELLQENVTLKTQLRQKYRFENMVGDSRPMQEVFRLIEKVADTDSTVLIQGESGTGKELVARALHFNSKRRERYLVPVNCGALPETLLESELFGHMRGAFTGATTNRIGRFEAAAGGTLFLDEIGDMSPALQVKLLRVLQSHEFEPVGANRAKKVDVRVIAATNRRLEDLVAQGKFREDLYYRLSVIPIAIPPLRERLDDIPLLANYFLENFCRLRHRKLRPFGPELLDVFRRCEWPGNVRELENLIERLVILAEDDRIALGDLPEKYLAAKIDPAGEAAEIPEAGVDFNGLVDDFENRLIAAAMAKARGNKNLAAQLLGLKRTTLVEKLKKKGLDYQ
jgi:DNA-binding NtrC family response regulator